MNRYSEWKKMGASKVTQTSYATKEDVILLRTEMQRNKEQVDKDCEYWACRVDDLYNRHDTMRKDLNDMRWYNDALQLLLHKIDELEQAPKIGKRRRRVTISYD